MEKLTEFKNMPVRYTETQHVKDGVDCDVYQFAGDTSKDLGIVTVKKGYSTPLQKVMKGDRTIEGFLEGKGILSVTGKSGKIESYSFPHPSLNEVQVEKEEVMSWQALEDLAFYEICEPPYEDGRFQTLD